MRRTLPIASMDEDPDCTEEMLDTFSRVEPAEIDVYSTFEGDGTTPIGHCVRLWRDGRRLFAEMNIADRAYWPKPWEQQPAPLHGECVVGFTREQRPKLLCVLVTCMPPGSLKATFAQSFTNIRNATN